MDERFKWAELLLKSDGGKVLLTALAAVFSGWAMGLVRDWRAGRHASRYEAMEGRDWELRCMRTELDLQNLDAYAERFGAKVVDALGGIAATAAILDDAAALLSQVNTVEARLMCQDLLVAQKTIAYVTTDINVEVAAHAAERPKYLERMSKGRGRPRVLFVPAPEPAPPTAVDQNADKDTE